MSNIMIQIEGVGKEYRLGAISHQTLSHDLQSWWARVRGKDDPNSPLMAEKESSDGKFWALKDVSLQVSRGEVVGIIGRNGAGKSTLLKILSRVTAPSRGEVRLRGRVASLLEVGTGFHAELTGRENVFLNGAILGMRRDEISRKLDEIVSFAELERFIDTPVKRYSSGMYMRLAFAVAAHLEPEILIVDEVLAVGDAAFQRKCLGKLGEVAEGGRTILFVSHNMQAVRSLCSRAILLGNGSLACDGPVDDVVEMYLSAQKDQVLNSDIPPEMHLRYPPDLEIIRLELTDHSGKPVSSVSIGEKIFLEISYLINKPDEQYRIGLVFSAPDQTRLGTIVSTEGGRPHLSGASGKRYKLPIEVENVFMDGTIRVSLHVKTLVGKVVDVVEGFSLTIDPTSSKNSKRAAGLINLDAAWADVKE